MFSAPLTRTIEQPLNLRLVDGIDRPAATPWRVRTRDNHAHRFSATAIGGSSVDHAQAPANLEQNMEIVPEVPEQAYLSRLVRHVPGAQVGEFRIYVRRDD
jgi:hypothetical protein